MNKKAIINYLFKNVNYKEENKDLLQAIEEAKSEMETANQYFNMASSKALVDYAIHLEDAAKTRLMYLLNVAKETGVKVDTNISLREVE